MKKKQRERGMPPELQGQVKALEDTATLATFGTKFLSQTMVSGDDAQKMSACLNWLNAIERDARNQAATLRASVRTRRKN